MENSKPSSQTFHQSFLSDDVKIQKILNKYLLGIFVARDGGDILYSKAFQEDNLNLSLMSNFIAALSMFGEENVGKIKRILIEGLNLEMNIVSRHGLILTMLFRPNMVKDHISKFYEIGLDLFYAEFQEQIDQKKTNQSIYATFDTKMDEILYEYLIHIDAL